MRCLAFAGAGLMAVDLYNRWANGKSLSKDVVIRSHVLIHEHATSEPEGLVILVFFDESIHPEWTGKVPPVKMPIPLSAE